MGWGAFGYQVALRNAGDGKLRGFVFGGDKSLFKREFHTIPIGFCKMRFSEGKVSVNLRSYGLPLSSYFMVALSLR